MVQWQGKITRRYKQWLGITDKLFERMSGLSLPKEKLPITLESRFTDLKLTFWGKILYKAVTGIASMLKPIKAPKLPDKKLLKKITK